MCHMEMLRAIARTIRAPVIQQQTFPCSTIGLVWVALGAREEVSLFEVLGKMVGLRAVRLCVLSEAVGRGRGWVNLPPKNQIFNHEH